MVTAAGYDCIDMRAVSNGEAATHKSTEDARIFTAEPGNTIRHEQSDGRNGMLLSLAGVSDPVRYDDILP